MTILSQEKWTDSSHNSQLEVGSHGNIVSQMNKKCKLTKTIFNLVITDFDGRKKIFKLFLGHSHSTRFFYKENKDLRVENENVTIDFYRPDIPSLFS